MFVAKTHFQNLLLAQPSKRLFISDSTPGAADVGVWASVGTSAVQILELHALIHVAQEDPGESRLISVADSIACGDGGRA